MLSPELLAKVLDKLIRNKKPEHLVKAMNGPIQTLLMVQDENHVWIWERILTRYFTAVYVYKIELFIEEAIRTCRLLDLWLNADPADKPDSRVVIAQMVVNGFSKLCLRVALSKGETWGMVLAVAFNQAIHYGMIDFATWLLNNVRWNSSRYDKAIVEALRTTPQVPDRMRFPSSKIFSHTIRSSESVVYHMLKKLDTEFFSQVNMVVYGPVINRILRERGLADPDKAATVVGMLYGKETRQRRDLRMMGPRDHPYMTLEQIQLFILRGQTSFADDLQQIYINTGEPAKLHRPLFMACHPEAFPQLQWAYEERSAGLIVDKHEVNLRFLTEFPKWMPHSSLWHESYDETLACAKAAIKEKRLPLPPSHLRSIYDALSPNTVSRSSSRPSTSSRFPPPIPLAPAANQGTRVQFWSY